MRALTSPTELDAFLDEHNDFADGFVLAISPVAAPGRLPPHVTLRLAYAINGNWEAGTIRRLREIELVASDVRAWTFEDAAWFAKGHCCQGVDAVAAGDLIGIELDLPAIVRLVCGRLDVADPIERDEWIEPSLSTTCAFEITGARLPTPLEWRRLLRAVDREVQWHMYGGGPVDPERVPANCAGWYLGHALPSSERPEPGPAVMIEGRIDAQGIVRLAIQRVGDADALWKTANAFAARLGSGVVHCGNCRMSTAEWLTYLEDGALPARLIAPPRVR